MNEPQSFGEFLALSDDQKMKLVCPPSRQAEREQRAREMAEKFLHAIGLLTIHGIMSDSERDKARCRLDRWAVRHGLRRKT